MCRCFCENEIFISFTKKLFEGVINLHYLCAKVVDPVSVKKEFDIPAASACWLPSKCEKGTKAFGDGRRENTFVLVLFDSHTSRAPDERGDNCQAGRLDSL